MEPRAAETNTAPNRKSRVLRTVVPSVKTKAPTMPCAVMPIASLDPPIGVRASAVPVILALHPIFGGEGCCVNRCYQHCRGREQLLLWSGRTGDRSMAASSCNQRAPHRCKRDSMTPVTVPAYSTSRAAMVRQMGSAANRPRLRRHPSRSGGDARAGHCAMGPDFSLHDG